MSSLVIDEATVAAGGAEVAVAPPARDTAPERPPQGWWATWRARFGLAEVTGTLGAIAGFAAGYLSAGSLLAAAGLATLGEAIGFYGCIGARTAVAAGRATAHLGGWRRLTAGAWHAVHEQLASCAAAEAIDAFLVRPWCLAGAAWLLRPLPGGVWIGFAAGKAAADVAWYGMEAAARRGVTWSVTAAKLGAKPGAEPASPYLALDLDRARRSFTELAAALPGVAVHYAVKANPDPRCGFPVRYDTDPPPLAEYAAVISRATARLPYPVRLACEPGRAIAAPAGTMVASVIGVAWRHGTVRVSLDTGAFHGLIEALESGRELRFPVTIPAAGHRMLVPCTLTGPSCDSQDTILDLVWLPMPHVGDQVLIGNAGAYTTCYSGRSTFNGYPAPSVRILNAA
jgi:Pyridoxal-dependent decarboxylase, C-terminal sheet domain